MTTYLRFALTAVALNQTLEVRPWVPGQFVLVCGEGHIAYSREQDDLVELMDWILSQLYTGEPVIHLCDFSLKETIEI
jgi:hypothetical protein